MCQELNIVELGEAAQMPHDWTPTSSGCNATSGSSAELDTATFRSCPTPGRTRQAMKERSFFNSLTRLYDRLYGVLTMGYDITRLH